MLTISSFSKMFTSRKSKITEEIKGGEEGEANDPFSSTGNWDRSEHPNAKRRSMSSSSKRRDNDGYDIEEAVSIDDGQISSHKLDNSSHRIPFSSNFGESEAIRAYEAAMA